MSRTPIRSRLPRLVGRRELHAWISVTPAARGTRQIRSAPAMRCALARGASGCTPLGLAPPAYSRSQVQPLPWRRPRDASAAAHSTPLSRANPSDRPPSLTRILAPPARISATSRECQDSVSAAARATRALACTSHRGHHLQPLLDSLQEFIRSTCSNSSSCRPPVTSSCSSSLLRRRLLTSRCALICSG